MTAIYTTPRIAHLIAAGKVTQHRHPLTSANASRLPWAMGHSHAVAPLGRTELCRVVAIRVRQAPVGELAPRDLHDTGHRTRLDLARWWLRTQITRHEREGKPWTDEEILAQFDGRHAAKPAWILEMRLDTSHQPRLLHEDPAQGYTPLPMRAAQGEPEAVGDWDLERQVEPARARHAALRGLIEQQQVDERDTLQARLERAQAVALARGVDIRSEARLIERRIEQLEQKLARAT